MIDLNKWVLLLKKIKYREIDEVVNYKITTDEDLKLVNYFVCFRDYIEIQSRNLEINSYVDIKILEQPNNVKIYPCLTDFVKGEMVHCLKDTYSNTELEYYYIKEDQLSSLDKDSSVFLRKFVALKKFVINLRRSCVYKDDAMHRYIFIDDNGVLTVQMDFNDQKSKQIIEVLQNFDDINSLLQFNDWFSDNDNKNQKGCCVGNVLRDFFKDKDKNNKEVSIFDILQNLKDIYIKAYSLFSTYLKNLEYSRFYREQQEEYKKFKEESRNYLEKNQFYACAISLCGIFFNKSASESLIYVILSFVVVLSLCAQGYNLFCVRNDFLKKIDTFKLIDAELRDNEFRINFLFKISITIILVLVSMFPIIVYLQEY